MSAAKSYADAPQEIKDAVEQLIRTYGIDPALLAGALVAATSRIVMAATLAEREANAKMAATYGANMSIWMSSEWPTAKLASNYAGQDIAAAIRKRGEG